MFPIVVAEIGLHGRLHGPFPNARDCLWVDNCLLWGNGRSSNPTVGLQLLTRSLPVADQVSQRLVTMKAADGIGEHRSNAGDFDW